MGAQNQGVIKQSSRVWTEHCLCGEPHRHVTSFPFLWSLSLLSHRSSEVPGSSLLANHFSPTCPILQVPSYCSFLNFGRQPFPLGEANRFKMQFLYVQDCGTSLCHHRPVGCSDARVVAHIHCAMTGSLWGLGHRQGQQELLLEAQGVRRADFSDTLWDLLFSVLLLTVPGCLRTNARNRKPTRELWEFLCRSSFSNSPVLSHPPLLVLLYPPFLPTPALLLPPGS